MAKLSSPDHPTFGTLTRDDIELLRRLARDVSGRPHAIDLGRLGRLSGVSLLLVGVILTAVGTFVQLALALPLSELCARPAVLAGISAVCAGLVVLALTAVYSRRKRPDRNQDLDEGAARVYHQLQRIVAASPDHALRQSPTRHADRPPIDPRAGVTAILGLARSVS